jgi:hypothetical protein
MNKCPLCDGTGKMRVMNPASGRSPYISFDLVECEVCKGTGEAVLPVPEPEAEETKEELEQEVDAEKVEAAKTLQKPAKATLRK